VAGLAINAPSGNCIFGDGLRRATLGALQLSDCVVGIQLSESEGLLNFTGQIEVQRTSDYAVRLLSTRGEVVMERLAVQSCAGGLRIESHDGSFTAIGAVTIDNPVGPQEGIAIVNPSATKHASPFLFEGPVSVTSLGDAIRFNQNGANAALTILDLRAVRSNSGAGIAAQDNGAIRVLGASAHVFAGRGPAVTVQGAKSLEMSVGDVTSTNSADDGIRLEGISAGSLFVNGTVVTITGAAVRGIRLNSLGAEAGFTVTVSRVEQVSSVAAAIEMQSPAAGFSASFYSVGTLSSTQGHGLPSPQVARGWARACYFHPSRCYARQCGHDAGRPALGSQRRLIDLPTLP